MPRWHAGRLRVSVRLSEIVNTAVALRLYQTKQANPTSSTADRQARRVASTDAIAQTGTEADTWNAGADQLDLSALATGASADASQATAEDDAYAPLGAIVDSYVRQRSTLRIDLPFGTGSGQGLFSFTLEVEEGYRTIQFLPGQTTDVQA